MPTVDPAKHYLQGHTATAKISALKVKSAGAVNTAQSAAAQARTQLMKVEETYVKAMEVGPELKEIKNQAKALSGDAAEASKESQGALKRMETGMKSVNEKAKELAVMEVKSLLRKKYHELSDWRHKVLGNPWEKAQVAAAKAADPYFKSMGKFAGSINTYSIEASNMRTQAAADSANANSLAAEAEAKQKAGDVVGSTQDREMSVALRTQSEQLAQRAATLDGQAVEMRNVMPQYAHAAQMAAWSAEYIANPDGVPPPPVDPNFAFASPEKLPSNATQM